MASHLITIKELKALLNDLPDHCDDMRVATAKDDEGNGFRLLDNDCLAGGLWDEEDEDFTTYDDDDQPLALDECDTICLW